MSETKTVMLGVIEYPVNDDGAIDLGIKVEIKDMLNIDRLTHATALLSTIIPLADEPLRDVLISTAKHTCDEGEKSFKQLEEKYIMSDDIKTMIDDETLDISIDCTTLSLTVKFNKTKEEK